MRTHLVAMLIFAVVSLAHLTGCGDRVSDRSSGRDSGAGSSQNSGGGTSNSRRTFSRAKPPPSFIPAPSGLYKFAIKFTPGVFSGGTLAITNQNAVPDLLDVTLTFTITLEDGTRQQVTRFWGWWKRNETKSIAVKARNIQVISMLGTAKLNKGFRKPERKISQSWRFQYPSKKAQ